VFLLDTNVVSELRKSRPHGGVVSWLAKVPDSSVYISVVTLAEIQAGIEITREQDQKRANEIEAWADQLSATFHVIPLDAKSSRLSAKLMHRRCSSLTDGAMLAATAKVHNLTVVTRNVRDFIHFDVELFNPFETKPD
jgi:predicted nucleic acid-binding protein